MSSRPQISTERSSPSHDSRAASPALDRSSSLLPLTTPPHVTARVRHVAHLLRLGLPELLPTTDVVGALSVRSPAFAELWGRHDVGPRTTEDKRFLHPDVGELVLHLESLAIAGAPGQHLSVYSTEPDSPTADALARLSTLAPAAVSEPW